MDEETGGWKPTGLRRKPTKVLKDIPENRLPSARRMRKSARRGWRTGGGEMKGGVLRPEKGGDAAITSSL